MALQLLRMGLVVLVLAIVAILVVNSFDQDFDPELEAYLADVTQPGVAPKDNAFYSVLGFNAPSELNPGEFGRSVAERYEQFLKLSPRPGSFDVYADVARLELQDWDGQLCAQYTEPCMVPVTDQATVVRHAVAVNQKLLRRYVALRDFPAYANPLTPNVAEPMALGAVLKAQSLWLASQGLRVLEGDISGAINALEEDLRFWRRMATQRTNLVEKIVALSCIGRDLRLLSDILRVDQLSAAGVEQVMGLLTPLTAEEKSLVWPLREEFRIVHLAMQDMDVTEGEAAQALPEMPDVTRSLFFKRNATSNRLFELSGEYERLAALPASQYLAQEKALAERLQCENEIYSWRSLYNPIGRILIWVAQPNRFPHIGRVHDLEGFMRLVTLQALLRRPGLGPESVLDVIGHAGHAYANPYTDLPMDWDADNRQLSFEGQGRVRGARIGLTL